MHGEVIMEPWEIQARTAIASALIVRGAVEVPALPRDGQRLPDSAGMRLRELTDYIYRLITLGDKQDPV
jgi:hypothetical protein